MMTVRRNEQATGEGPGEDAQVSVATVDSRVQEAGSERTLFGPGTVSVVTPVYNAEPFVAEAVASALALEEVGEVLLVEDGSPDGALAVCQRLSQEHPQVRLLRHPDGANKGAGASRNLGVRAATRPFIAFLDADDRYLPNRFTAEHRVFREHPDADGVYGALSVCYHSEEAKKVFREQFRSEMTTVAYEVPPERLFETSVIEVGTFGHFHIDALTVRSSVLFRLSKLFDEGLRLHQDTELLYRLMYAGRLYAGSITRPVALRGVHDMNRITSNRNRALSMFVLYDRLNSWAAGKAMSPILKHKLWMRRALLEIESMSTCGERTRYLRRCMAEPELMNDMDVRKAYWDSVFGTGSALSGFAQKLSWRVLNKRFLFFQRDRGRSLGAGNA